MKTSKTFNCFKIAATQLMTSNTPSQYEKALNYILVFIEKKPTKRSFLKGFVDFWHPRRHHISRAFKCDNAPKSNLSETFHSSYATGQTTHLTLIEAAYRDTAAAIKLERSLKMFGEGYKCQGSGPTT